MRAEDKGQSVQRVLGIDPGRVKCGLGIVDGASGVVEHHEIIPRAELQATAQRLCGIYHIQVIALGSGTEAKSVHTELEVLGVAVKLVDEYGSTLAARARYFQAKPPRSWKRFIPRGLLVPEEAIDDWAAVIIAERLVTGYSTSTRC